MSRVKSLQERLDVLKREEQMLLHLRELLKSNCTALMMEQDQLMALIEEKQSVLPEKSVNDEVQPVDAAPSTAEQSDDSILNSATSANDDILRASEAVYSTAGELSMNDEVSDDLNLSLRTTDSDDSQKIILY
uniref:snRNA-activating protein complex subunit 5 n=1 Tax=Ascaris lumbricoides TaxID=6252 RepID=A0A0M3IDM5_ASCLU